MLLTYVYNSYGLVSCHTGTSAGLNSSYALLRNGTMAARAAALRLVKLHSQE